MSPLELSILIHYKGHADDFNDGDFSAPAVRDFIDKFIDTSDSWTTSGMLEQIPLEEGKYSTYRLTEKGHVFVDALCALRPPIQVWVMPPNANQEK